jgi:hypothetical protein
MDGAREASAHTIVFQARAGTPELNCCSVNGPRGLGMLSEWAVMAGPEGPVVNYYGPLKASLELAGGLKLQIEEETYYPWFSSSVLLIVRPEREAEFTLKLRIPAWSRQTRVTSSWEEKASAAPAGAYLPIRRLWRDGDQIDLHLDTRLRLWAGDRNAAGKISIYTGPILLAYDQRFNPFDEDGLPPLDAQAIAGGEPLLDELVLEDQNPIAPMMLCALRGAGGEDLKLCDFASAGAAGTRYRTWLPALNVPPPPVVLQRPRDGERIPRGKALFTWGWPRRRAGADEYTLLIAASGDFSRPAIERSCRARCAVLEEPLEPGRDYRWKLIARNKHGVAESEARTFRVDPELPALPDAILAAGEPGPGEVLLAAPLRGDAKPAYGALLDAAGVETAAGPAGDAGGGLAFDGEQGRVRYAIPYFPQRDYTVTVRFAPRAFPEKRIAQVFSAWAAPGDDPLRITIDGGRLFARIEAQRGFSTEGVPLERGTWVAVAAVKQGAELKLYVGGEERARAAVPEEVDSEAASVALGGNPNFGGNEFLAATIADFALYARALSPEEIKKAAR